MKLLLVLIFTNISASSFIINNRGELKEQLAESLKLVIDNSSDIVQVIGEKLSNKKANENYGEILKLVSKIQKNVLNKVQLLVENRAPFKKFNKQELEAYNKISAEVATNLRSQYNHLKEGRASLLEFENLHSRISKI